jgi:hypothetical protein
MKMGMKPGLIPEGADHHLELLGFSQKKLDGLKQNGVIWASLFLGLI